MLTVAGYMIYCLVFKWNTVVCTHTIVSIDRSLSKDAALRTIKNSVDCCSQKTLNTEKNVILRIDVHKTYNKYEINLGIKTYPLRTKT